MTSNFLTEASRIIQSELRVKTTCMFSKCIW